MSHPVATNATQSGKSMVSGMTPPPKSLPSNLSVAKKTLKTKQQISLWGNSSDFYFLGI